MRAQLLFFFSVLAFLAGLAAPSDLDAEWYAWKQFHGKEYEDESAEEARKGVWAENHQLVEKHNSANLRWR